MANNRRRLGARHRSREVQPQGEPAAGSRPLDIAWITDELIEEHRRVWSSMYGRDISESEAIEINLNIKRFAEAILYAVSQEGQP
jgi:hypothetical protein